MGLRNKMGILSESFAHDRFYERMNGTYGFVAEITITLPLASKPSINDNI